MNTSSRYTSISQDPPAKLPTFSLGGLDYRERSLWTDWDAIELFPGTEDWPYVGRTDPTGEQLGSLIRMWSRAELLLSLLRQRSQQTSNGMLDVTTLLDETEERFVLRIPTGLLDAATGLLDDVRRALDEEQFERAEGLLHGAYALISQIWRWGRGEGRTLNGEVLNLAYIEGWRADGQTGPLYADIVTHCYDLPGPSTDMQEKPEASLHVAH